MTKGVPTPISARQRLAFNMRARRAALGFSQEVLGDLAGLHRTYIGSIERCNQNVSLDNIEKIALALGLDISHLMSDPSNALQAAGAAIAGRELQADQ